MNNLWTNKLEYKRALLRRCVLQELQNEPSGSLVGQILGKKAGAVEWPTVTDCGGTLCAHPKVPKHANLCISLWIKIKQDQSMLAMQAAHTKSTNSTSDTSRAHPPHCENFGWLWGCTWRVLKSGRRWNFHLFFACEVEMWCNDARQAVACILLQDWGCTTSASPNYSHTSIFWNFSNFAMQ